MIELRKAFKNIYKTPEPQLSQDIWMDICRRRARTLGQRTAFYMSLSALSMASLVLAIKDLVSESAQSGFSTYASAAFADGRLVTLYWKELLLSLADSLPVASLLFTFVLLFVIFISLRKAVSSIRAPLSISMQS